MSDDRVVGEVEALVDQILERCGRERIRLAMPAGLGKANHIANELVRRALEGELGRLEIYTALSLMKPDAGGQELVERLMGPIAERCFGDYPDPVYAVLRQQGDLPEHVQVHEFYYPPGALLNNRRAQQNYLSINFTGVNDALWRRGFDVVAQMVAPGPDNESYDLSCNPDLALDLFDEIRRRRERGEPAPLIVGQVNNRLPQMGGDALVAASDFDWVLQGPRWEHELFGRPTLPPSDGEYLIGIQAAALLADGGTLQIGIGNIGDAVAWAALLRHRDSDTFGALLTGHGQASDLAALQADCGGDGPFEQGLYASSEMLVEGLVRLYQGGVLCREVFGDLALQQAANSRGGDTSVDLALLDALVAAGRVGPVLDEEQVGWLVGRGVFNDGVRWHNGELEVGGEQLAADLGDEATRAALEAQGLGQRLSGGAVAHGAFFLGSQAFYDALRGFDDEDRQRVRMTRVSFTNLLYGQEELKRAQRQKARFVNECMKVTLTGAVVSDGLEDGRVVSGVGGQYEFVAMAHALPDARSIIVLPAVRERSNGEVESNVVFSYGHHTIPRHLRDVIITEYGAADLRGKTDEEVACALICIADARFQDELLAQAKEAGKVSEAWQIPAAARGNTAEAVAARVTPLRRRGVVPRCPFGTELTDRELDLAEALAYLGESVERLQGGRLPKLELEDAAAAIDPPPEATPYLERMGLDAPKGLRELAMQRMLVLALAGIDKI